MKFPGKRPGNLGIHDGLLAACPNKPNCVSSQATDKRHFVAPFRLRDDNAAAAMQRVKAAVEAAPRARVIRAEGNYLHAEFETPMMGFVDDVEFYCAGKEIHVRSAARLGYSDWGVNRKRVESLRKQIEG